MIKSQRQAAAISNSLQLVRVRRHKCSRGVSGLRRLIERRSSRQVGVLARQVAVSARQVAGSPRQVAAERGLVGRAGGRRAAGPVHRTPRPTTTR